ncbi:MAG: type II toxin-antitoxin system prevent-host-death family antitoxin [Hyphomicrobium sp.]
MRRLTLTTTEFQDQVGDALDRALSQLVVITENGRPRNVLLSYGEYQRLMARDRRVVRTQDLTEEDLAEIEASEMEPSLEYLNAELEPR